MILTESMFLSDNQFEDDAAEELVKWIGSLPNLSDLYLRNVSADQYPLITETLRSLEESRISTLRIWGVRNSNNKDEVTDFQSALIDLLQSSKTLKQLKIGWDGDLVPLAEALLENRSIEQFIFAFVRNMAGVAKFFEMTSKHPTLHNIELYSAPSLGRPFSQSLAHPGSIRKATFKLKEGDGETPENLWKALQTNNTLEEIHISVGAVNELDVGGPDKLKLVSFAQGLGSTSSLRVLDFSEINLRATMRVRRKL
ncbi:hypothetical protein DFJ73DRAFT_263291 [Zopfochytrium polystomum]|nr:hypothetical protein DFJ73DRAFT_263291 [Zopfochytrium polystomum]